MKYKNIFAKGCALNWPEEVFVIKTVKSTVSWIYVLGDLNDADIVRIFYEKESQKVSQKDFRIEKVSRRKVDKLYVKRKGYNNSWVNKIDIVM